MIVQSVKYVTAPDGKNESLWLNNEWAVPLDPDNSHYQAIQEWVADGNTIEEAD